MQVARESRRVDKVGEGLRFFAAAPSDFEQRKHAFVGSEAVEIKIRGISWAKGIGEIMFGWVPARTVIRE